MDDGLTDIGALKKQIVQLEGRIGVLSRELDRATQLIDLTGEIFGRHLKLLLADQGALALRLQHLEHPGSLSAGG